jgi:hypothetical protein
LTNRHLDRKIERYTHKRNSRLERLARDKHSSLLRNFVNYDRKNVFKPWPQVSSKVKKKSGSREIRPITSKLEKPTNPGLDLPHIHVRISQNLSFLCFWLWQISWSVCPSKDIYFEVIQDIFAPCSTASLMKKLYNIDSICQFYETFVSLLLTVKISWSVCPSKYFYLEVTQGDVCPSVSLMKKLSNIDTFCQFYETLVSLLLTVTNKPENLSLIRFVWVFQK